MNDEADGIAERTESLARVARQLIEGEELLGGEFLPAGQNPLPEIEPSVDASSPVAEAPGLGDGLRMPASRKAEALRAIDEGEVRTCTRCPLCRSRTRTVFGEVNPDADLVFLGEGPGADEDLTGRPFVGRAGELLTKMIHAMGLKRQDVFICNIVKCRPPGNRVPTPDEVRACWGYLVRQLQIIQPSVIVTLGNPATQNLLDTRTGITQLRGQWSKLPLIGEGLDGIDVMPTFHPAFLLRQYNQDTRGKVWSDLQQVMAKLGLEPPTERQK